MEHARVRVRLFTIVLVGSALVAACSGSQATTATEPPPIQIDGGDDGLPSRLTLSESAADRLDIRLSEVAAVGDGRMVPSAAVIIDTTGTYWVYINPEPLVYTRRELRAVYEVDGIALFDDGPDPGTPVVITGVPELYGAEFGIGK